PEWLASLQTEEPALPASEPAETGETPDWLASLQTEEPALPAAEPAETGETPDWLASLQTEEPALPASEPAETGETPDWLAALQPEEAAQPIEEPAEADLQEMPVPLQTELPDWMTQLDVIEKGEEVGKTSQAMEEEMPKWLQELENEVSEEEVLSREGTIEEQKEIEVDKELPDWVQNTETLRQPEETDTAREDKTLLSQITNLETPTSLPVTEALISPPETISAVPIESEPSPLSPFPQPTEEQAVAQGTQEPSIVKPQLEEITADLLNILEQARASMKQNDLPTALEHYSMLVETGQFLEDVIKDIQEALYRHPVDIDLWETYGDAHFKANHIQEALDAYTKAEELFR
ncbi:MAG: hypothetical protein HPY45_03340, partial [Anaerolineae bacterium]|nr:hypothetical protein [Anaerolineae bacterium]